MFTTTFILVGVTFQPSSYSCKKVPERRRPVSGPWNGDKWPEAQLEYRIAMAQLSPINQWASRGRHGQTLATNTATAIKPTKMNEEASGTAAALVKSTRKSVVSNDVAVVAAVPGRNSKVSNTKFCGDGSE